MNPNFRALFLFIFLFSFAYSVYSQSFILKQTHENGVYKTHEKVRISAVLSQKTNDSISIKVWKNNDQIIFKKTILPDQDLLVIFESTFKEPCSVMVEAKQKGSRKLIGLVVAPGKLKPGSLYPKDFEAYWNQEKQNLNALLMEVKTKKMNISETDYECQDVEINCTGPKPARGYFAKPIGAKVRSLPIVLIVRAAGVKGSWCRSEVANAMNYAKKGNGVLCFDLNAHGMLNGQPDEYYSNLETGELKDYYVSGLENRDEFYFRGMYLRLIRTLEFLTRQPEWDGKRIIVIGESQGGGQALAAAGLDSRVSAVVATEFFFSELNPVILNRIK